MTCLQRIALFVLPALPVWAALPVITSFTTSSQTANGGSVTLNCTVTGTTTDIEIDNGSASFSATSASCGGGISKTPTKTTLYKLVAGNNTGTDGQAWAYQRIFFGAGTLAETVTNCPGATQNSASCVITISGVSGTFTNPYTDMVCDVTFTAPSSATIRRTSYWDPKALVWKISLRPTEAGSYSWAGWCGANPSGGPNNYHTVSGSFNATASSASGFLALYGGSAPYRLKTSGDGKPFYPVGIQQGLDTDAANGFVTFLPNTPGTNVYPTAPDSYFSTYAPAGTNIYRNNGESFSGLFGGQYCDANGLNNFDTPSIFALDTLAAKSDQYGIKLQTVPYFNPDPNLLPGYNFFSSLKTSSCVMGLWLEYFARYGDQTNVWELGNEILPNAQYIKTLANFIRTQDPYRHLSTISNVPAADPTLGLDLSNPHFYFSDTIDPTAVQTLDQTMVTGTSGINAIKALFPNQPLYYGEIGDNCPVPDADPPANERWRDMLWISFTNQTGAIAWNSFNGNGAGCGSGLSNLYVGTTQRAQQLVFVNLVANFDPLAVPVSLTLGNLGSNTARAYALVGASSGIAYITHANNHSTTVTGATLTLTIPSNGLTATWYNPFNGSVLGTSTPSSGSQTLTIPAFSQDIVLKLTGSGGGGGTAPTITSTSPLPGGTVGIPYAFQFAANGNTPISWGATGPLPWATLNSTTGVLSGTPTSADVGTKTLVVTATNSIGNSGPQNFSLTVTPASTGSGASFTLVNSGGTVTNYPLQFAQPFVQGEVATCPQVVYDGNTLTSQADVKQRWPDGSVKHAILAGVLASVTGGTHTVTFVNQACTNTPLTKTQMLAAGFNFGATMALTNGSTVTGDARVMLSAWDGTTQDFNVLSPVQLWTSGQIAQTAIIALHGNSTTCNAHPCSTYDIGFDANKSLRPIFHATFWPGTNQVHIRYIGEMANSTTVQASQSYSLALTAGNTSPATVYTKSTFIHSNGQRWTKDFWIGGAPPSTITLVPNLSYLRLTKFTPYYDTSNPINPTTATNIANAWTNLTTTQRDIGGQGNWTMDMTSAGSRSDIGLYPSWVVAWLYDGRAGLRDSVFGNSDLQASWPFHFREGSSGKILNRGDAGSTGLGKVISISGRPTMCINPNFFNFNASPGDQVGISLGNTGSAVGIGAQGWIWDAGHIPEAPVIPYTLTGDFWYLEESMFYNSVDAASGYQSIYYRGPTGAEGSLMYEQLRAMAWNLRGLSNVTFVIPDAMPEKTYFRTLLSDSVAIEEGIRNVTTGAYNGTTLWTYGRNVMASNGGGSGTTFDSNGVVSILHQYDRGGPMFAQNEYGICSTFGQGTPCNPPTVSEASPLFETDYMLTSLGRCKALGYLCDSLLTWASGLYTGMLTDPGFNPYILDNGRVPTYTTASPPAQFTTFAQLKTGYQTSFQNATSYGTIADPDGYLAYATAAVSYMTGETNGTNSWNFLLAHGMSQATFALDPKWHLIPSTVPTVTCNISGTLGTGTVGVSYGAQMLTANSCGISTLTWTILSGSLPPGLSGCSGTTGTQCTVSGTPTSAVGSPYTGTIRVSDGGANTANFNFSIVINAAQVAPTITSTSPLPTGTVGTAYSFQFTATGTTPISWSGTSIPAGLTLSAGGLLSGTPSSAASNTLAITATNGAGTAGPTSFTLVINAAGTAPVITTTSPITGGTTGVAYSFQFAASGTTPISWSATGLPAWATFNNTGLLQGTPNAVGTVVIAVTATNSIGSAGPTSFSLTIAGVAPTITSTSPLPTGVVGTGYSFQFAATGTTPLTWSATGLPSWASLNTSGLLTGTPTAAATTSISVSVTNSAGSAGPTSFSLPVIARPLITSTSPITSGTVGVPYTYTFAASGTAPITWTATGPLPWATLHPTTGIMDGTPTSAGTTVIAVTATNAAGADGPKNFSITIASPGVAPAITSTSPITGGVVGTPYSFQFLGTGTAPVTWTVTNLPAWGSMSTSGLITGTPTAAGTFVLAVTATNQFGVAGPTNFSLTILAPPTITSTSPLPAGTVGTPYTFQFTASGATPITWGATGLPGWASLSAGGALTGTPSGSPTTTTIAVTATNAVGNSGAHNFSLPIVAASVSPTITSTSPLPNGALGVPYSFNMAANGTAPITWSATGLPGWASLSAGGMLTGTPNAIAVSSIAITATNVAGSAGPTNFSLTVPGIAPTITSVSPLPGGTNGVAYSFQFAATGTAPITWSATGLPSWASLSSGGLLTGTPDALGTTVLAVTATNGTGSNGPTSFSLTIVAPATAPTITSTSPLPNAPYGAAYSYQFTATGTNPITWFNTGLPSWASLSSGGLLTGTPNSVAVSSILVTASNSIGTNGPTSFSLTVPGVVPAITSVSPLPGATVGVPYSFQFTGTGAPVPTWSATGVPAGLSLSAAGRLSGTPTTAAVSAINVTATNSAGTAGPTAFALTTVVSGTAPNITSLSPIPQGYVGHAYTYQLTALGSVPLTWSATGVPAGLSLSASGVLSGTPTTISNSTIAVTVTNAIGSDGPQNFTMHILRILPGPPVIHGPVKFSGGRVQ